LYQDACTIAGIAFAAAGTSVFHVFQNRECIRNNLVVFIAFDIGYKSNSTCIVLEVGAV
jgi:hypothetical protein